MQFINRYIAVALVALTLTSCEKEVIVDVPEYEPKLVLNSYTETGDTIKVMVGKSISILDYKYDGDLGIKNASVVLRADGEPMDVLEYDPASGLYKSHTVAVPGKQYTLSGMADGYTEASAATRVPVEVKIDSVRRIPKTKIDIDGNQQDEIRVMFKDPPAPGDYYVLSIHAVIAHDSDYYSSSVTCVNTTDASVESIYNEEIDQTTCLSSDAIYFRDVLFNGTNKELRLFVQSNYLEPVVYNHDTMYAEITLYHVTEDYFRFSKTYNFASENLGNPFAEPANVYSNVKNGYGIFSVKSKDVRILR